ncbi:MAG: RNA 2',3'-cyclic phosphodiesterase [Acidimicrobiia bacterium]
MTALRRAFVAVVPPPAVLDSIEGLFDRTMRSKFRWTRRDQWHVTVQYFGKVPDSDALVGALAGAVARVPSPTVQIGGAGGFPSPKRAAVFWLGVVDPKPLQPVYDAVIAAGGPFLRARDVIPYVPHLTLARLDPVKKIADVVEALDGAVLGPRWTAEELVLLESETRRGGSVYRPVARLPFG